MTEKQPAADLGENKGPLLKRLMPLIILVGIALLVISQGWHKYLGPKEIAYNLSALQAFISENLILALLAYMGIYIIVVALSLPGGAILSLSGGLLFGWQLAAPTTIVAATIGATIIFLVVKTSLGETLAAKAGPWLDKLRQGFQENALSYLLFLRLVPTIPFFVVNLAPALLGVPLRTYIIGTFIGIIPGSYAFAYAGRGLDSVLEAGRAQYEKCVSIKGEAACDFPFDLSVIITNDLLIAFGALSAVALIPVVIKKFRKA